MFGITKKYFRSEDMSLEVCVSAAAAEVAEAVREATARVTGGLDTGGPATPQPRAPSS